MRFRFRYKAGWTAFIFIFALAGVILTFRQWNENKEKDKLNKFMPHDNLVHHDNNVVQSNQVLHPPLQDEQDVVQRLPKQMVPNMDPDVVEKIKRILTDLDPQDWGQAKDADEMALDVKTELSDLGYESPLSCKEIDALRISSSLKVGKKKYVDRAYANYPQSEVVLKSQAVDQSIKIKCMQKFYDADKCHVMGNYFLIREIVLMSVLKHPSIINLLGYCLRGDNINYELKKKGIILVTEPGRSVELSTLSMQNWADRLMYALQLAELLNYLEHSPLGSLGLVGIRADDFVLVDRHLKLSDLDDLRIEEPACRSDDECHIPGVTNSRISCDMGRCKKRNAKANLQRVGPTVFEQLLRYPPNEISDSVGKLRQKILTLEITAEELVQSLKKFSSAGQDDSDSAVKQPVFPLPLPTGKPGVKAEDDDGAVRYVRFDQHNFPGIFDYSCQNSRVVWGCVMTVRSLKQAKEICNKDHNCKSFVLFTSNPDLDVLMTMVAKNSAASKPEPNVGATLFVKSDSWSRGGGVPVYNEATGPQKKAISYQDCYKKMINVTKDARFSREKRLMAHLGLKGLQDKVWRKKVKTLTIVSHKGVNQLSASTSIGGRFNVQLGSSKSDKRFNNAIFMSEIGPTNYHIAHMIVYHTPPSVIRTLSKEEVEAVKGDAVY
ncbi:hypothetical protein KUTeg_010051 [Tegillarca granosa]|uniref:FAM69 protein-kinase domain-containing protein n=1 Tax=Tegillarca granosa TaxID=220873 RepID=A0ABQ9F5M4_TEGGR|nr:hypothetical protein KUTeg_010051 [Tegillarca granosa]